MWSQFRRLLLGTVIESLLEEGLHIDFKTLSIEFHEESAFKVPRLDNYMRFKGQLSAVVLSEGDRAAEARLEQKLKTAWPGLLAVVDIPIGDRLSSERNHIDVVFDHDQPPRMVVHFDLEAD